MKEYIVKNKITGKKVITKKKTDLWDANKIWRKMEKSFPSKYIIEEEDNNGIDNKPIKNSDTKSLF